MMKTEYVVRIRPNLKIFKGYPDLTPYVCVFFILLIFFMMGANFVPISGIQVDLPSAQTKVIESSKQYIVTIDKDGNMYFNDLLLDNMDVLKRRIVESLNRKKKRSKRETLIIRADAVTDLNRLAPLMSLAEELNLNAVIMANQQTNKEVHIFMDREP